MSKVFGKKSVTVMLSAALLGGVFVTVPNALNVTEAQADAKSSISYSQFLSDVAALKAAVQQASPKVQSQLNSAYFSKLTSNPKKAYGDSAPSFMAAFQTIVNDADKSLDSDGNPTSTTNTDFNAITAIYEYFMPRLSTGDQDGVANGGFDPGYIDVQSDIESQNGDAYIDLPIFAGDFEEDFYADVTPSNITGIPAAPASSKSTKAPSKTKAKTVKKSSISKLTAKKSSKKYVKVTGHATLYKQARYARIKTYRGYKYAKLSSHHNFSKKIYAPKAKTVKVAVGNYSHGHFSYVTSTKTAHVK
ncbi:hypothetical protein [Secundilactobacillus folii]|uniref:Surface layer protein A domain-containing protein n=1 Tax=Secundilactobacillus folii TaxID=2678357 RepID=A0A7X2XV19_9LACO|nr:hypothetical protein [Secundilactobacillus folii]MTV82208.1 hypothetical protein [Secundilactobacillus folii]